MQEYIYFEKNSNPSKISSKYFYNYFYYITKDNKYIYNKATPKKEINFDLGETEETLNAKITSFTQSNSQNILCNIFSYILDNNLLDKTIIKFTINNNDHIRKIEKFDIINNL